MRRFGDASAPGQLGGPTTNLFLDKLSARDVVMMSRAFFVFILVAWSICRVISLVACLSMSEPAEHFRSNGSVQGATGGLHASVL